MKTTGKTTHSHAAMTKSTAAHHATPAVADATTASPSPPQSFADRVTAAVAAIAQAKSLLSLPEPSSVEDVKRAVKLRKGGEQYVPTLALLSARYGLEVPSRPTSDMTAQLEQSTQLEPARAAIGELSSIVDGAYFTSRCETWTTATSLYSMLKQGGARAQARDGARADEGVLRVSPPLGDGREAQVGSGKGCRQGAAEGAEADHEAAGPAPAASERAGAFCAVRVRGRARAGVHDVAARGRSERARDGRHRDALGGATLQLHPRPSTVRGDAGSRATTTVTTKRSRKTSGRRPGPRK